MFNPAGAWQCLSRDQAAGGEESQGGRGLHPRTEVRKRSFMVLYVSPWSSSIKGKTTVQKELLKHRGAGWHQQWLTGAVQGVHAGSNGQLKQPGLSQGCARHLVQVQPASSDL